VNNLPKVVTRKRNGQEQNREFNNLTTSDYYYYYIMLSYTKYSKNKSKCKLQLMHTRADTTKQIERMAHP